MSDEQPEKLVVYSDYLCPFCYLGKASLEEYLESSGESPEIEWRPFDIQGHKRGPDGELREDVDDGKDEAYFEQARQNVQRLKKEYDVEMNIDLAQDIDSWNAQKVALFVERNYETSTFVAFHNVLFEALWKDQRDIGDPDVLAEIAEDHGIEPEEVREAADDEELDDELDEKFRRAQQMGIRGIPTFIYGDYATQGAVSPEQFDRLFDKEQ